MEPRSGRDHLLLGVTAAVGIAIRIALMPLCGNLDAVTTAWLGLTLAEKGQIVLSNDPLPIFAVTAGIFRLMRPILDGLPVVDYLTGGLAYTPGLTLQGSARLVPGVNVLLYLTKIPYLISDLLIAWALLGLAREAGTGRKACMIWMLNPITLYISYVVGQFDAVPTALFTLSLLTLTRERWLLASLLLGMAAAFKTSFLLVAPLFGLYGAARHANSRGKKLAYGFFPLLVSLAMTIGFQTYPRIQPFYESANLAIQGTELNGFFGDVFYNRGRPGDAFFRGLAEFWVNYSVRLKTFADFTDELVLTPLILTIGVLLALRVSRWDLAILERTVLAGWMVFFALHLFHVQWFMWAQPLLVLWLARRGGREWPAVLALVAGYTIHTWRWDRPTTVETLLPGLPLALVLPGPHALLRGAGIDPDLFISLGRSVFSGGALYVAGTALADIFRFEGRGERRVFGSEAEGREVS
jgi:hypothetical protein